MSQERQFVNPNPLPQKPFDVSNSFLFETSQQAQEYLTESAEFITTFPRNIENNGIDIPLVNVPEYGMFSLRTFHIGASHEAITGHTPKNVLIASPHCDDEVIATGAFALTSALQGDKVRALQFTVGSGGRYDHGYNSLQTNIIRLRESLESGKLIGLEGLDVIVRPDNGLGLPEWFSNNDELLRRLGVALGRVYDADIVLQPHPDVEVDSHIDHNATAKVMDFATGWGRDSAFHPEIPFRYNPHGKQLQKMLYSVWSGGKNIEPNFYVPYDPEGPIARVLARAISIHRTQSVKTGLFNGMYESTYAAAKILRDTQNGLWRDINNPNVMAREGYLVQPGSKTDKMEIYPEVLERAEQIVTKLT